MMSASTVRAEKIPPAPALRVAWINPESPAAARPWHALDVQSDGYIIYGTKLQLQCLGIGIGAAFPGEPETGAGAAAGRVVLDQLMVTDAKGNPARLWRANFIGPGLYGAHLPTPGVPPRGDLFKSPPPEDFQPGVTVSRCGRWDRYVGTAEALTAAGIVPDGHFPGLPGMRKTRVTIHADGSLPSGAPTANNRRSEEEGARKVSQVRKGIFEVCVVVSTAESERRREALKKRLEAWEALACAIPRPALPRRDVRRLLRLVGTRGAGNFCQ